MARLSAVQALPACPFTGLPKLRIEASPVRSQRELKGDGPRINVLSPGPIGTPGNGSTIGSIREIREYVTNMVPRGRIGRGSDIAKAAVFLASSDSSFVAGAELFVDGGLQTV